MYFLKL